MTPRQENLLDIYNFISVRQSDLLPLNQVVLNYMQQNGKDLYTIKEDIATLINEGYLVTEDNLPVISEQINEYNVKGITKKAKTYFNQ